MRCDKYMAWDQFWFMWISDHNKVSATEHLCNMETTCIEEYLMYNLFLWRMLCGGGGGGGEEGGGGGGEGEGGEGVGGGGGEEEEEEEGGGGEREGDEEEEKCWEMLPITMTVI